MIKRLLTLSLILFSLAVNAQDPDRPFTYDTIYRAQPLNRQLRNNMERQADINRNAERESKQEAEEAKSGLAPVKRRGTWHLGGTFGMSFGDYTNISIAPQIGYSWNRYFTFGGGISYNYYDDDYYDYSLNYLGMHLFGRFYPIDYITLYVQPEVQRRWGKVYGYDTEDKVFMTLLLGAGAVIPISARGGMTVTFYYDVLQNKYTPYGNRIGYSVGYTFNF